MKKKYSTGGQLAALAANFIPGYGQLISPLILSADSVLEQKKAQEKEEMEKRRNLKIPASSNIYGLMHGGLIQDKFKQFNTGSHSSNKDLNVNQYGKEDMTSPTSVQNKENLFMSKKGAYVMSDTLTNPLTGNKFNEDASKVNKKYKNTRLYEDQKNSFEKEMSNLTNLNDLVRQSESFKKAYGGVITPKYLFPLVPSVPPSENINMMSQQVSAIDKIPELERLEVTPKPISITERSVNINPLEKPVEVEKPITEDIVMGDNLNPVALALKGLSLGSSIYNATRKAEIEKPILPDYTKSDRYIKEASIDYTQAKQNALGISNLQSNLNRQASSNYGQFSNRESARIAQLQDQYGNIDMQEANSRSQLNLNKGQYESSKSLDTANRLYQNRIDNQQNKATADFAKEKLFSELSQIGSEFNRYQETKNIIENRKQIANFKNSQVLAYLNSKYPNVQVSSDVINKFTNGEIDIDSFLTYFPSNIQTDVRTNVK